MSTTREGYALPMTLAAIAILAMVSAMAAYQLERSSQAITALNDHTRAHTELLSAQETLIYLLLTETMGISGIQPGLTTTQRLFGVSDNEDIDLSGRVLANGTPYHLEGTDLFVRLYDPQGLITFSGQSETGVKRALSGFQIAQTQQDRMAATLADYQDENNIRRLGGAEAVHYPDDLAPPPNRRLREPLEVCAVLGWQDSVVCEDPGRLLLTTSIRNNEHLNPRLVSREVIGQLYGDPFLQQDETQAAYERLTSGQVTRFGQLGFPEFDANTDIFSISGPPGPDLIIVTHTRDGKIAWRSRVRLTTGSVISPFFIQSKYAIGSDYVERVLRIEGGQDVAPLPEPGSNDRIR